MTEDKKFEISYRAALGICIAGALIVLAMPFIARQRLAQYSVPTETATTSPATPANAEIMDPRANDVEPSELNFVSRHPMFKDGKVTVRNCHGNKASAKFTIQKGTGFYIASMTSPDFLTFGPYIVTVRSSDNKVTATFRIDRTGHLNRQFYQIYIRSGDLVPMLTIYDVRIGFEPLGRETYPAKMEG